MPAWPTPDEGEDDLPGLRRKGKKAGGSRLVLGLSIGGGALVLIGVIVVAAVLMGDKGDDGEQASTDNQPVNPFLRPAEQSWAPPTKAVRQGDLQVRIAKASIGQVPVKDLFNDDARTKSDLLMVKLDLLNTNPTKKLEYRSWAGQAISLDSDYAILKDNFGNRYKLANFGFSTYPAGAVNDLCRSIRTSL
jgi:hypothetical protein